MNAFRGQLTVLVRDPPPWQQWGNQMGSQSATYLLGTKCRSHALFFGGAQCGQSCMHAAPVCLIAYEIAINFHDRARHCLFSPSSSSSRARPKLIVFPPCESVLMKVPPAVATEAVGAKLPAPQGVDGMG